MNPKVKAVIEQVMETIRSGNYPEVMAHATFTTAPISRWSWLNRLSCQAFGTQDARGFNQWKAVERHVTKGAKAIHILVPCMKKMEKEVDGPDGPEIREYTALVGFRAVPVFAVEHTEGKELDYQAHVRNLDFEEVAQAWGLRVVNVPKSGNWLGAFTPGNQKIALASPDTLVFAHELAHAAHQRVLKDRGLDIIGGQNPEQELVAELAAMVLCRYFGCKSPNEGRAYQYLQHYADGKDLFTACRGILGDVDLVCQKIIETAELEAGQQRRSS